jgi:hypothetical protein
MQTTVTKTSRRSKNEAPSLQGDFVHHAVWRSLDGLGKRSLSGALQCSAWQADQPQKPVVAYWNPSINP